MWSKTERNQCDARAVFIGERKWYIFVFYAHLWWMDMIVDAHACFVFFFCFFFFICEYLPVSSQIGFVQENWIHWIVVRIVVSDSMIRKLIQLRWNDCDFDDKWYFYCSQVTDITCLVAHGHIPDSNLYTPWSKQLWTVPSITNY